MRLPPNLMDLPRELRDCIWEACLTTPSSPPESPDPDAYIRGNTLSDETVSYPGSKFTIASVSLLRVNRAVNAEVQATILRLYAHHRVNSKLNILIRNEKFFRLDWLLLPVDSLHYDYLEVDFRFTGLPSWHGTNDLLPDVPDQSFFQVFHPEPNPKILYCLAAILRRFVKWGPAFQGPLIPTEPPRRRSVRHLSLNVVSPSVPPERFRQRCDLTVSRRLRNTREAWKSYYTGMVHPKAVVLEFEMLIWRTLIAPRKMSCTSNVYDCIETIDVRLDGHILKTWNLRSLTGQLFQAAFLQSRLRVLDHNCGLPVEERFGSIAGPRSSDQKEEDAEWRKREGRGPVDGQERIDCNVARAVERVLGRSANAQD
ncbi:uncharacterized protein J3D65DRAFT_618677 [Phyllosticta citribraziliensis]|uniref:Uncharacterized protein n=1 Tax=Phyllosticta citribraziliensis TaxID=989973 RepID=A0ABR1LXG3_9PEZI